ncbi:MAG: pseudouridine synthase [Gammaproteobacteria bacterium]
MKQQRLQKILARVLGISRRNADALIVAGRVAVDGRPAQPGVALQFPAKVPIHLDGELLTVPAGLWHDPVRMLLYHKAVGSECSYRPADNRKSIFEGLPELKTGRWFSVGRLDVTTSGLLVFANDGDLVHRMMHPSYRFDREYMVRVQGAVSPDHLDLLTEGIELEDGMARFSDLVPGSKVGGVNCWYCVTLMEGRNHLIHRLFAAVGHRVSRIHRVRFGPLWLPDRLRKEHWLDASPRQLDQVQRW